MRDAGLDVEGCLEAKEGGWRLRDEMVVWGDWYEREDFEGGGSWWRRNHCGIS